MTECECGHALIEADFLTMTYSCRFCQRQVCGVHRQEVHLCPCTVGRPVVVEGVACKVEQLDIWAGRLEGY